ncbi:DUF3301 domain-containing protein [Thiorhodospira sibirica]|uniref:DUF3301 domain-containing protein n=1 Tax=Thiorhodospira sibirica TaxID=154347 RepID=UPI00022C58B3|nr:DUF3301 domain-containing protein [Thiorhodospira sibirica]
MSILLWLTVLGAVALYINDTLRTREKAAQAAAQACREVSAQLLDQSVMGAGMPRLVKDAQKRWRLRREYVFEFTVAGEQRYTGRIICLGGAVYQLSLEHPEGRTFLD